MGSCKSKRIKNHNDYIVKAIKDNPGQILKIYRENSREFSVFTIGLDQSIVENKYIKRISLIDVKPCADEVVDDCCICLEPLKSHVVSINICTHTFHRKCIQKQLGVKESCPLCRSENDINKINEIKRQCLPNEAADPELQVTNSYSSASSNNSYSDY